MNQDQCRWHSWQGARVFLSRLLLSAAVWWILTGGDSSSWIVGAPAVLMAALVSSFTLPALHWSWRGAAKFWVFFLRKSLLGGIDVATRAFHRRLPLDPGMIEHHSRLSLPAAAVSVANTVSLLPGTLAADFDDDTFYIHALDTGKEATQSIHDAERHIAELFGLTLAPPATLRGES